MVTFQVQINHNFLPYFNSEETYNKEKQQKHVLMQQMGQSKKTKIKKNMTYASKTQACK